MSGLIIVGQQAAADRATDEATVKVLQQAMTVISAVCDYAQELDARGFSAADAWLGHVLAQMSPGLWSDPVALTAWDMLRKYRGQLSAAGIDYDQLPRPAGAGELEAGRREQAREHARGHAQAWREQQYRQTHSYVRCDGDGDQVVLAFPYDPDMVAACRKIDGRSYDGATKTNVFPFTSLPAVLDLAARHGIDVTADVRALAGIATQRAAERAALPQVRMDQDVGTIIIDASLDPALYEKVKELDARWDSAAKVHRVPGHHVPVLVNLADQHGLRVSDQVRQSAADTSATQEKNRSDAGAFEADPLPVPGLATGRSLKPQQYPVVRFALAHRRVLIGDDMGWGKTLSSLAAVAADGAYPAVVVCRPSLTMNWAAEIRRFFPDLVTGQVQGTTAQPVRGDADVIIIGSAALAAKPRKTGDGGKEFGWVEELKKAGPKALIIDEGQDTKERAANRSQACEQLAASVIARDGLVLDLTGTAILNRPRELCQQLTILGRIAEFGGPKAFLWRYCLSETNQWGASYDGARNLIELHDRLRSWGIMIRRSDDAALGLPPCREHVLCVPQTELDTAVMNRYRQAEADLLGFLAGKARQAAAQLGKDPDSAAVAAAMRASAAEHLVAINTLRQLAGQAKRGYVTGWVREHVRAGEKVMVAAHHREEVDAYAAAFGGLKLQGGQPVAEKETVKARFQQQPASQAPVIAVAIGAGGVGHTLTAAAIGIQAEQAWTPGETQQMKKRLHRIGQDREVDYYVTVAEGTIDEHLWAVVTAKQATLDAVLDGRSDTGAAADDRSVAAELTWRLTQQGLGTSVPASPVPGDIAEDAPAPAVPELPARHDAAAVTLSPWRGNDGKPRTGSQGASTRQPGSPPGVPIQARASSGSRSGAPFAPASAIPPGTCIVPGCGEHGRLYPAGTLCDGHRPGPAAPQPQTCPECGLAVPAHAAACTQRPASLWPAAGHPYGLRDQTTVRHWQQAHVNPDKVRAWCRDTGRAEPPARGALPPDLVADYLADRGAIDIPLPGDPDRTEWLAQRPVLRKPHTVHLGWPGGPAEPFTVVYGPCPRCGHPAAALPGEQLPLCAECAARPEDNDAAAAAAGSDARMIPSALDEAALAAMRADAKANARPFTDPAVLRKAEVVLSGIDAGWLVRVVGHPVASWRYLNHGELLLAVRAAEADAGHLGALAGAQRAAVALERQAAAAAAQAKTRAAVARWQRLREQLPVPVTVQHNWTARHLEGYEQGADHIVVLADLQAGRFRRDAGTPLCQTASRAHQLRHVHGNFGDERRLPDCKACLRVAGKLAAAAAGSGRAMESGTNHDDGGNLPGATDDDDETVAQAPAPGQGLREAAHRYLENGLLPVPAWAARQNGECCCPRGAGCDRPGKHPRSVRTGPGPRDYSWRPLVCRTHIEIDQRFAPAGEYAAGNLMVAIPEEMMAIDRDDDDGGRAAIADLAGDLGELPSTLAHRTPHGEHLIYSTPRGWTGRAWVGKDPANPVPPGVDLRMPGQVLMAAPSVVPGQDGPARYGPITGDHVAALPARYVTAWTPSQPQPRPAGPRVPVPPERADRAARYVHDAMTGIAKDLASRQPGGRNAAAYAAGLKAGSLLGAARATPGAEQAAAAWTDEAAEEALMDAAERNGYTGKDGHAEARRAIRSGLRNGLRNPRALPDFTTTRPDAGPKQPPHRPAPSSPARPQPRQAMAAAPGRRAGRWQDMVPDDIRRQIEAADQAASNRRRATTTAHQQALLRHSQSPSADTAAEVERTRAAADAAHQAYTRDGRHVTGRHDAAMLRWAAAITAHREESAGKPTPAADSSRMQANRAAVAANEAYKAGDLDQARVLTDQAAALDPSRAGLWQQHRNDIAARQLILSARAAHAEGDHERAGKLLQDARQLDPRLRTLWDSSLPAQPAARITRETTRHDTPPPGPGRTARTNRSAPQPARSQQRQPASTRQPGRETPQPAWPSAPGRREPGRPTPAAPQPGTAPSSPRPPATAAAPHDPEATASADAKDPDPDAVEDVARWRSPNPRSQPQAAPIRQDWHTTSATPPAPAQCGSRTAAPGPAPAADWRDQILRDARQPWSPAPSWPHHPAISRLPHTDTPDAGIEPGR